jgi:hypothetical protein
LKKSTFSISSESDKSEKSRQCLCEIMHDWDKCVYIVKLVRSSNWKCNQHEIKLIKNAILKSRSLCYAIKKTIDINILKDIKTKDCKSKKKDDNDKKSDSEKTTENDILNVKFANMISLRSSKYVNMFIEKTFNNFLWRSVVHCYESIINENMKRDHVLITSLNSESDSYSKSFVLRLVRRIVSFSSHYWEACSWLLINRDSYHSRKKNESTLINLLFI